MPARNTLDVVGALTAVERRLRARAAADAVERSALADALADVKSAILKPPPPPDQAFVAAVLAARRAGLGGPELVNLFNAGLEGGL